MTFRRNIIRVVAVLLIIILIGFVWSKGIVVIIPSLPDTIEDVMPSVVHIRADAGWQGSGFAITNSIIATARHCVKNGGRFTVTMSDGTQVESDRAVYSKKYDIGFIKLGEPILKPVELGSIDDCRLGQSVFVIGSPYGGVNFNAISLGIISGLDRDWDSIDYYTGERYGWEITFTTDAAGHPGNSGCPVFTMAGRVVGVLVGGYSPVLIGCMPSDLFADDLRNIELLFALDTYQKDEEPYWYGDR